MAVTILAFVAGCAALKNTPRASGNGEILVPKMPVEAVTDFLAQKMAVKDFQLRSRTPEEAVFVRPSGSTTFGGLYSSGPSRNSEALLQVTCRFQESDRGVFIKATSRVIENPGSVNERFVNENQWDVIHEVQVVFQEVKKKMEAIR